MHLGEFWNSDDRLNDSSEVELRNNFLYNTIKSEDIRHKLQRAMTPKLKCRAK